MSLIKARFDALRASNRKALIPFVTAGDPEPDVTVGLMHALVAGGADLIELGVPFSDPMADGPVIQHASERALSHSVSLRRVLEMVREFRRQDRETPVVLMGYLNPIEAMGYECFAKAASEAGVDGVLTVDLPPEEADEVQETFRENGLDPIFLVAPTTVDERIERICQAASGFVYYVSVKGITGAANLDTSQIEEKLEAIRKHTDLPVGVGFGIKDGPSAARVAALADAVIVGSALVSRIETLQNTPEKVSAEAERFIRELRSAIDEV